MRNSPPRMRIMSRPENSTSKNGTLTIGRVRLIIHEIAKSSPIRMPRAMVKPSRRARAWRASGRRAVRIAMNTTLSMPRTISSAESETSDTSVSAVHRFVTVASPWSLVHRRASPAGPSPATACSAHIGVSRASLARRTLELAGAPHYSRHVTTLTPPIKQIASGLRFPEGPVAMPDGSVILVEIERRTLSSVTPDGKVRVVATLGGGPNGAAMGPRGKIYVTNNGGLKFVERPGKMFPIAQAADYRGGLIQVVDPETGKFETLYDACDGRRLCGPNDLVFDRAGGFWFTDLGKTRERDMDRGAVYYANADGSLIREAIFPLERPNGIGLSPDERTLYVVETPTARCWAFKLSAPGEIESANGTYRGEKGTVVAGLGGYQMFDSLAVDREGHICVATLITGAVSDIWPDGSRVDQYKLPDMMVTNVCFGGPDFRTAFATLSMGGTLVSFEWPRPGLALNHLNTP